MEYKVSVVVPVYNAQKHLSRCVDSILNQTYQNIELILVDDGSADNSAQMCDDYAQSDNRVKVVHKENAGAGMARNTGLEYVTGEFILFVDSDDYIGKDTISKCIESAVSYNSDTVVFGYNFVSDDGKVEAEPINAGDLYYEKDSVVTQLLSSFFTLSKGFEVSVWGKLFSSKIIADNSLSFLSEREMYSEDALFLLTYFVHSECASVVPENLYYYCDNDSSISRVYDRHKQDKLPVFLQKALEIAEVEGVAEKITPYILARYQSCAMVEYKHIVLSDMSFSDKIRHIKEYSTLGATKSTLRKDVISLHRFTMKMFYFCIRYRMYLLGYLLLYIRLHK